MEGSKVPKHKSGTIGATDLRNKLMNRFKSTQEIELERQKNRLKKVRSSGILGLALKGGRSRSPSINTISSDDSIFDAGPKKKKKKKLKKKKDGDSTSTSSSSDEGMFVKENEKMHKTEVEIFLLFFVYRNFAETSHRYDGSTRCFSYV